MTDTYVLIVATACVAFTWFMDPRVVEVERIVEVEKPVAVIMTQPANANDAAIKKKLVIHSQCREA